jgi:hypothetical protein
MSRSTLALIPALAVALTALLAPVAAAGTYRWVDKDGVVHYSDRPMEGAQKVPLPAAQTYEAPRAPTPAPAPRVAAPATESTAQASGESPCAITSPAPEQVLLNVPSMTVSLRGPSGSTPQLTFDGNLVKDASGALSLTVSPIARGEHTVSVAFFSPAGQEMCRTPAVRFYVRQASLLSPLRKPNAPRR